MAVQVDPDKLLALAKQVYNDSTGKMYNARYAVQNCTLDVQCFGLIATAIIGGPYESARKDFEKAVSDAYDALNSAATGMANVATIYEQAENANITVLSVGLPTWGGDVLPGQPSSLPAAGYLEFIGFAALGIIYADVVGALATVVALAPITAAAFGLWAFTKPDDDEINAALSMWNTAVGEVKASRADLTQTLTTGLEDAWPTGDGARDSFDSWMKALEGDLAQLETAIGSVPGAINSAVTDIHVCSEWLLGILVSSVATLIVLTTFDVFFGAGEGAKNVVGAFILAAVASTTTTVVGVLGKMAYDIGEFISDRGNFKNATTNLPDFTKLSDPLAWQTPAPSSVHP